MVVGGSRQLEVVHLELSKVEEARQLEGAPLVEVDSRAEKVEGEGGGHGAEELQREPGPGSVELPRARTPAQANMFRSHPHSAKLITFHFLFHGEK